MKHIIFVTLLFVCVVIALVIFSGYGGSETNVKQNRVCCSFTVQGQEKTCAAPDGQSCAACQDVCATLE